MKLYQNFYTITILFIISTFVKAQESKYNEIDYYEFNIVEKNIRLSELTSSIANIDSLIESKTIKNDKYVSRLYYFKADFLKIKYNLVMYKETTDTVSFLSKAREILKNYDLSIKTADCKEYIKIKHYKYLFLKELVDEYKSDLNPLLKEEYEYTKTQLVDCGLKPERFGLGISAGLHTGKNLWASVGISLISSYTPKVAYKTHCGGEDYYIRYGDNAFGINFFAINFATSFSNRLDDVSVSLIDMYAPLRIIPARFGYIKDPIIDRSIYYYRPGIGLNIGIFSISYSYTMNLNSTVQTKYEKSLFSFELNYPLINNTD